MRGDILLFLSLVAVVGGGIIAAVILLFADDEGGGSGISVCDDPLPPRGVSDISESGFQAQDAGLTRVIEAASEGNLEATQDAFFGEVHDFTRDVDQPLREVDEELAKDLCQVVNRVEEELAVNQRPDEVAAEARRIRGLLRRAAEALGYDRPGQ
jgi:hypothetical protein